MAERACHVILKDSCIPVPEQVIAAQVLVWIFKRFDAVDIEFAMTCLNFEWIYVLQPVLNQMLLGIAAYLCRKLLGHHWPGSEKSIIEIVLRTLNSKAGSRCVRGVLMEVPTLLSSKDIKISAIRSEEDRLQRILVSLLANSQHIFATLTDAFSTIFINDRVEMTAVSDISVLVGIILRWAELLHDLAPACIKSSAGTMEAFVHYFNTWIHSSLVSKFLVACFCNISMGQRSHEDVEPVLNIIFSKSCEVAFLS